MMWQRLADRLRSRAFLAALGLIVGSLGFAAPAAAQYPCPAPGPNDRVVGTHSPGPGLLPYPICVPANNGPAPPPAPARAVDTYASIAWHPDVEDVWLEGNFDGPNGAVPKALEACRRAMGDGCQSIGEWSNSSMAIARDWNGYLHRGWGQDGGIAREAALEACRRDQPLPCEIVGTFGSGRQRAQPDMRRDRKLYGAGAWVEGLDRGQRTQAWIATGLLNENDAANAAIAACQEANPGLTCVYWAISGNGVVQTFMREDGPSALPERDERRALRAMREHCATLGVTCRAQAAYDSRRRGLFVHDFGTGRAQ
ncbi:DUF4189 domain-containing protein [Brevundimonas sp.]|jgi:hypothetical protein|uniref:DUF4189 domain-containing protein n=1 Tax=Brevundimonas sp. TaxID=1871086 RepID=UPI002E1551C1|nr:DUF4189 domain-containing protein [Brevundimonas sp.]